MLMVVPGEAWDFIGCIIRDDKQGFYKACKFSCSLHFIFGRCEPLLPCVMCSRLTGCFYIFSCCFCGGAPSNVDHRMQWSSRKMTENSSEGVKYKKQTSAILSHHSRGHRLCWENKRDAGEIWSPHGCSSSMWWQLYFWKHYIIPNSHFRVFLGSRELPWEVQSGRGGLGRRKRVHGGVHGFKNKIQGGKVLGSYWSPAWRVFLG